MCIIYFSTYTSNLLGIRFYSYLILAKLGVNQATESFRSLVFTKDGWIAFLFMVNIMKKYLYFFLYLSVFGVGSANAATLIDFNSLNLNDVVSYTESGVTFTTPGSTFKSSVTPNGTKGLEPKSPRKEFRADILGGASFVSIDLGDFGGSDLDNIYLKVFDISNTLLGSTTLGCCQNIAQIVTLSLSAQNISYALFGSRGTNPNTIFSDNFRYEPSTASAVPVPGAIWLFISGLLGLKGMRRKVV